MSDPDNHEHAIPGEDRPSPWRALMQIVAREAELIAEEIMADAVLGESIATCVSRFKSHHEKLSSMREKFAKADQLCADLRREARQAMRQRGHNHEWNDDNVDSVDGQLAMSLKEAAANAAAINKMRSEASMLDNQLLARAIDEIALCASISVLRNIEKYSCQGEAFCVAYLATGLVRESTLEDLPAMKAAEALSDWLQYSIGVKTRVVEVDIYAHSRIACGIGRGMGISNNVALRIALIEAMKKTPGLDSPARTPSCD
ncbi:MAG TPA: hypothetical protein VIF60_01415 [Burkholderiaceae bacterium]|jgi:hypothetical protein